MTPADPPPAGDAWPEDLDARALTEWAAANGRGDGLPLLPPTAAVVDEHVASLGQDPDTVVAVLPPRFAPCTVRDVARAAAMTAAPPAAIGILCASLRAMAARDFDLMGLSTTTEAAVPAVVVNGDVARHAGIPSGAGCLGGAAGAGPAVGRALRLVLRHVGGQVAGVSSWTVHGQPGRVVGIVVAEAEERSPWPPLAARRGVPGDAVTTFAAQGTIDVVDAGADAAAVVAAIGSSLAVPATPPFLTSFDRPEVMVAICPAWADLLADRLGDVSHVQGAVWEHAWVPAHRWPPERRERLAERGRVDADGRVHAVAHPEDLLVVVCGGPGGLHATALHGWGATRAITEPLDVGGPR